MASTQRPPVGVGLLLGLVASVGSLSVEDLGLHQNTRCLGKLAIVIAVGQWVLERDARTQARDNAAWSLIMSARDASGDGGRQASLEHLNLDGISLAGVPMRQATLNGLDLDGADLQQARFDNASLKMPNFRNAELYDAWFSGATIVFGDFRKANAPRVHFQGTILFHPDFTGAHLTLSDFTGARVIFSPDEQGKLQEDGFRDALRSGGIVFCHMTINNQPVVIRGIHSHDLEQSHCVTPS